MSQELITKYVASFFKGVRPGWKQILFSAEVKPALNRAIMGLSQFLYNKGVRVHHLDKNGLKTYLRPNESNIFEFLKYCDPQNVSAIIIGQDPYTKPNEAHGLSFSVPKKVGIPHSLRAIYDTLIEYKLIDDMPKHGNLVNWAKQGILLMNRCLTRSPNIQNDNDAVWINGNGDSSTLHTFWATFTDVFLQYLTGEFLKKHLNHPVHQLYILLWGNVAKNIAPICNITDLPTSVQVKILEWGHPSPANTQNMIMDSPLNFRKCPHFAILHKELGINWDPDFDPGNKRLSQFYLAKLHEGFDFLSWIKTAPPSLYYDDATDTRENTHIRTLLATSSVAPPLPVVPQVAPLQLPQSPKVSDTPIIVGIDGGCPNNGHSGAHASYGVYFHQPYWTTPIRIYGCLAEQELMLMNDKLVWGGHHMTPTNCRGELLGAIHALMYCIQIMRETNESHPILMIMDATYTMHLINERIWRAAAKDITFRTIEANRDLVIIIYQLLLQLAKLVPTAYGATGSQKPWDILMQPAAHNNYALTSKKIINPMDRKWGGLTLIHQRSHLSAPAADTDEYISWHCNHEADLCCNNAIVEYNPSKLGPFIV